MGKFTSFQQKNRHFRQDKAAEHPLSLHFIEYGVVACGSHRAALSVMSFRTTVATCLLILYISVVLFLMYHYGKLKPNGEKLNILKQFEASPAKSPKVSSIKLYVYNWSSSITDRWPKDYKHHRLSILPHYRLNGGIGMVLDDSLGLYSTHQYALFEILVSSLRASTYITTNPDEADFFFVPYDLGMDSTTRHSDGALSATNCPVVNDVIKELQNSKYFRRFNGTDHILVHSINQPMTFFANRACRRLYEACWNCLKLSIDTYPTEMFDLLASMPSMTNRWISVPFPSNFHWSKSVSHPPWSSVSRPGYFPVEYLRQRNRKICFVGSAEVTAKKQRYIRESIIEECRHHSQSDCWVKELSSHSSNQQSSSEIADRSSVNPYAECRLCLCPGGDFPTRKAVLDALLAGCIPVTFELEAAIQQWPWHWGNRSVAESSVIFVDRTAILAEMESRPGNLPFHRSGEMAVVIKRLLKLANDLHFLETSLRSIAAVGHRLQYRSPLDNSEDHPQDAFDVIMQRLKQIKDNGYNV